MIKRKAKIEKEREREERERERENERERKNIENSQQVIGALTAVMERCNQNRSTAPFSHLSDWLNFKPQAAVGTSGILPPNGRSENTPGNTRGNKHGNAKLNLFPAGASRYFMRYFMNISKY